MGGIWKQPIRSLRQILAASIRTNRKSLDDKALRTLMVEVKAVVNSKPLNVDTINDADSKMPIYHAI